MSYQFINIVKGYLINLEQLFEYIEYLNTISKSPLSQIMKLINKYDKKILVQDINNEITQKIIFILNEYLCIKYDMEIYQLNGYHTPYDKVLIGNTVHTINRINVKPISNIYLTTEGSFNVSIIAKEFTEALNLCKLCYSPNQDSNKCDQCKLDSTNFFPMDVDVHTSKHNLFFESHQSELKYYYSLNDCLCD